jgi:hypothetical protein
MDDNTATVICFAMLFIWSAAILWLVTRRR